MSTDISQQIERHFVADNEKVLIPTFCDLVQVAATDDYVVVSFYQTALPVSNESTDSNCMLFNRIALTWPHFERMASAFSDIMESRNMKGGEK